MIGYTGMEYRLGLIGQKLGHSVSPAIHRAALEEFGLPGEYQLYSVPAFPEGENILMEIIHNLKVGKLHGVNVTIPYKQVVIPYLDLLTDVAKDIHAVNTIYLQNGRLYGDNTDVEGFLRDLMRLRPSFHRAVVFGAGGAARAAAYGLVKNGCYVKICSRRKEQSRQLVEDISYLGEEFLKNLETIEYTKQELLNAITDCDLIVNATPCGMYPDVETSIWIEDVPFPSGAMVYDMVYNPPETALLRSAKSHHLEAVSGLGMLVYQAIVAFQRWTGKTPSFDRLYEAAEAQLSNITQQKEIG